MREEAYPGQGPVLARETLPDGRRALVVPGRLTLSWQSEVIAHLDGEARRLFEFGIRAAETQMLRELDADPDVRAAAAANRAGAGGNFVLAVNTPSVTIEYPDRNARYHMSTELINGHYPFICEAIDPELPLHVIDQTANGHLPNPWNAPDYF